ncbi:MAG: hypothetical protein ACE5GF_00775 [Thermodesulfobacteriota bacterium]
MAKTQIPVYVDDKVYYGCCQGCVNALKTERTFRFAQDPVTGREVDKADAFIIEGPAGEALYFESLETAERYFHARK